MVLALGHAKTPAIDLPHDELARHGAESGTDRCPSGLTRISLVETGMRCPHLICATEPHFPTNSNEKRGFSLGAGAGKGAERRI